ncbi:sensor histidine kinase, partial [Streptococcus suis]
YTQKGSIISTVDLPTTDIIEPFFYCVEMTGSVF